MKGMMMKGPKGKSGTKSGGGNAGKTNSTNIFGGKPSSSAGLPSSNKFGKKGKKGD